MSANQNVIDDFRVMHHVAHIEFLEQLDQLCRFDQLYRNGTPMVSDAMYDALYKSTLLLYNNLGFEGDPPDIFKKPGWGVVQPDRTHRHLEKMLSLDNIFDWDHIRRLKEMPEWGNSHLENKWDGVAVSLTYQNGYLICASTRGDGEIGELINPVVFSNIPKSISIPGTVEIRGEGIIPITEDMSRENTSLRNIAAGHVRRHVPEPWVMDFIAYGVAHDGSLDNIEDYHALYQRLAVEGFTCSLPVNYDDMDGTNPDRIATLDGKQYEVDGLVLKMSRFDAQKTMGASSKFPRYAYAYKYGALGEIVHFESIVWQVGRTGIITPVAKFKPIQIGGVMVESATLHNAKFVMTHNASVGAMANVVRSGDVIPYVESIISTQPAMIPQICPCCESTTVQDDVFLYCSNQSCPERRIQQLEFLFGKGCLDIDGLGIEAIRKFYILGILKNPWDIFNLCNLKNVLVTLTGFGELSYEKLTASVEKSRDVRFDVAVKLLSIPDVGRSIGKKLEPVVNGNLLGLEGLTRNDLSQIHGIGDVTASKILNYFASNEWLLVKTHLIPELRIQGNQKIDTGPLSHLKICVTGKFEGYTRESLQDWLRLKGATVVSGVNSETDILLCPEGYRSSKLVNAKKHNVTVVHDPNLLIST